MHNIAYIMHIIKKMNLAHSNSFKWIAHHSKFAQTWLLEKVAALRSSVPSMMCVTSEPDSWPRRAWIKPNLRGASSGFYQYQYLTVLSSILFLNLVGFTFLTRCVGAQQFLSKCSTNFNWISSKHKWTLVSFQSCCVNEFSGCWR